MFKCRFNGVLTAFNQPDIYGKGILHLEICPNKDVCYYFYKEKLKAEVCVKLCSDLETVRVYYFKPNADKHYKSREYFKFVRMPEEYYTIVKYIHPLAVMAQSGRI